MEAKKSTLQGQAGELLAYLDSILNQLYGFELPEPDSIFSAELMESQKKLEEDAALLISALETMKAQLEEIQAFAPEAEAYVEQMTAIGNTVYQELSAIDLDQMIADATALAKEQAIAAAKEEFSGLPIPEEQLNEIVNNIMSKVDISSVAEEARVHISKVEETLTSIPQIEIPEFQVDVEPIVEILQDMQSQFTVLETAADQQEGVTQLLNSAQEFMDSVKESSSVLRNKSSELIAGLDFADSAIKNAQDYINTLRTAASEASQGSAQLSDGAARSGYFSGVQSKLPLSITTPPRAVPCPQIHLVAECMLTLTPQSEGRKRYPPIPNVLSARRHIPCRRAMSAIGSKSGILNAGLARFSTYTAFVFSSIRASRSSTLSLLANLMSIPMSRSVMANIVNVPP